MLLRVATAAWAAMEPMHPADGCRSKYPEFVAKSASVGWEVDKPLLKLSGNVTNFSIGGAALDC